MPTSLPSPSPSPVLAATACILPSFGAPSVGGSWSASGDGGFGTEGKASGGFSAVVGTCADPIVVYVVVDGHVGEESDFSLDVASHP